MIEHETCFTCQKIVSVPLKFAKKWLKIKKVELIKNCLLCDVPIES